MGHSVGHEDLIPFAVVADCSWVADVQSHRTYWSSANDSQWFHVPVCRNRKYCDRRVTHTCDKNLTGLFIHSNSRRMLDRCVGPFYDTNGSNIAFFGSLEDEYGIVGVI